MNPQEILPSPEIEKNSESNESFDNSKEIDQARRLEKEPGSSAGSGAVTAVAVDDAQTQVQGVMSSQPPVDKSSTYLSDNPAVADDLDLIEKEWVKKAKTIVMATMGDPYNQNKKINEIKVDYIKKRYNKDIKLRKE